MLCYETRKPESMNQYLIYCRQFICDAYGGDDFFLATAPTFNLSKKSPRGTAQIQFNPANP